MSRRVCTALQYPTPASQACPHTIVDNQPRLLTEIKLNRRRILGKKTTHSRVDVAAVKNDSNEQFLSINIARKLDQTHHFRFDLEGLVEVL